MRVHGGFGEWWRLGTQVGALAVMTARANWHDAVCMEDLLNSVVTERPDTEQHLCLDKGYDNPTGH